MTDTRNNGGPAAGDRYQHRSGGTYEVIGVGMMQAAEWLDGLTGGGVDMAEVVVYQADVDWRIWVRPLEEFMDGRFTLITARSPSSKEA